MAISTTGGKKKSKGKKAKKKGGGGFSQAIRSAAKKFAGLGRSKRKGVRSKAGATGGG